MSPHEIQEGMELIYGGGPVDGGWFTVMCTVIVLRCGNQRFKVRHVNGQTPGKVSWVTASHLTRPAHR